MTASACLGIAMPSPDETTKQPRSLKHRWSILLYVVYLAVLLEIFARLFLVMRYDSSFFKPQDFIYHYYPELRVADESLNSGKAAEFRVLILGGSVISHEYSHIDSLLYTWLTETTGQGVESFNMAIRAHTSLDSYYKYRHLQDQRWDLVVFYQSINELRTNNCPGEMYRDDYSHYAWYDQLNTFFEHGEMSVITSPLVAHLLYNELRQLFGIVEYLPPDAPSPEMLKYGIQVRSEGPFRQNLERIVQMTKNRGERLLLMTFAYHIPPDYSLSAFEQNILDYADHTHAVEMWGPPVGIYQGLEAHNAVIRELAGKYPSVCFVDQDRLMLRGKINFRDLCHLTRNGSIEFANHMVNGLRGCLQQGQ